MEAEKQQKKEEELYSGRERTPCLIGIQYPVLPAAIDKEGLHARKKVLQLCNIISVSL